MTFISFPSLSGIMSSDNRGLALTDKASTQRITGTGTPAEEKEEEKEHNL